MKSKRKNEMAQPDKLGELIKRGMLVGLGILILQADGFRNIFLTILGSLFAIGPIVTAGPIETSLKVTFNRVTRKFVGREVFIVQQRDIQANMVIGQNFGPIMPPSSHPYEEEGWKVARNFTLRGGDREWEPILLDLEAGQPVKGSYDADDDVWAFIVTRNSLRSFERGDGFTALWDASQGNYAVVDFEPERPGKYYLVIANFDPEDDTVFYDDEEDVSVQLRLKF